jgi:hypothetical protein
MCERSAQNASEGAAGDDRVASHVLRRDLNHAAAFGRPGGGRRKRRRNNERHASSMLLIARPVFGNV